MTHVVVGIIIKHDKPDSYLLVCSNKDFGAFSGYYYPPAGHVENNEDELSALKREIKEELNLNITATKKITDTEADIKDQKTSWYLCEPDDYKFNVNNIELKDAGYFTQAEMVNMQIWPATLKVFAEYIFTKNN